MADLKFVDQHNMVACLEKTEENAEFHQIVDFLSTCSINYALTVSPTIYASYIEQFWNTATSKTVNSVKQIHAIVDGKVVVISESSVRSDLLFNDEDGKVTPLFDSMLVQNQAPEGEGSAIPPEPQPTPSTSQPNVLEPQTESLQTETPPTVSHELQTKAHIEQILPSPSTYQRKQRKTQKHRRAKKVTELPQTSVPLDHEAYKTQAPRYHIGGADAQTRPETASKMSRDPPLSEVNTSGRGEDSMEYHDDLTDFVPPTPHDSPLSGGNTPGSDEGRMELIQELMETCTSLTKRVLALEEAKTAQDRVITRLKLRVKRLEKKRKARTPQPMKRRLFKGRVETSTDKSLGEDASKQGRNDDKTEELNLTDGADTEVIVEDKGSGEKGGSTADQVSTARPEVSAASVPVNVSAATPSTPPTTTTIFGDEDLTIAQTLMKMRSKGVLVEEEPEKPVKVKKKGSRQEEATSAALAKEFDEIQAKIDADHELDVRLTHEEQEKYTIEERARLLAEFFERRKKQLAAERAEAIRNKPATRTQLYEREKKWIDDFKPIDDDSRQQAESTKKRPRADSEEESSKKQKLEDDNNAEKEELRDSMDVVPRDDVAIDVESLATKYPIVDWKIHILKENIMYYQIIRADGSSKNYKIFSEMLDDFDRLDVIDLHRLVNERYETTSPEGYDLLLWGDLKTLFEPNEEDEIWKNQQDYNLIRWRLFDLCRVHVLLMNTGVAIHMMIEKKYPLTQEMLSRMLNRRLEVDYESEMAFELLRFTRSQLQNLGEDCWELKASEVTTGEVLLDQYSEENNKSKSDKGYHAVLPPFTGNFIPFKPDLTFVDEIVESENMDVTTIVTPKPKTVRKNSFRPPVIEDWNSDDIVRSGKINTTGASVNMLSDQLILLAQTNVNHHRQYSNASKKGNSQQKEYKEKGVIDSGCSRHMTKNKCYLTEYEDYDGGFVSFRDGKVNSVKQIHAIVDGKAVVISESLVRSDLLFNDEDGIACLTNDEIFETLALMRGGIKVSQAPRKNLGCALAQTRLRRRLVKPKNHHLQEGHISGSEEGSMEHTFELMDTIPPTPYDSPLTGGYTPGSDEDEDDASKQEKESDKTKSMFQDSDFDVLDDDMKDVEGETVNTATTGVSVVSAPVTTAGVAISTAEPRTPLTTAVTAFIDEDLTIAQTLVKMRSEKAKVKGVSLREVEETPRLTRSTTTLQPLPTIDPKDKAQRLHEEELVELDRAQKEKQKQEEATNAALAEEFDEIQARMDVDHELAVRLTHEEQEKYTIEERATLLAEYFERRKKQLAAEREEAIRNKPPTRAQKLYQKEQKWINDFKPMDSEEDSSNIKKFGKRIKRFANSTSKQKSPMKFKVIKEQASAESNEEAAADYEQEKEKLRMWLAVVPDEDETVDPAILSIKYPIVDWESQNLGSVDMEDIHVYKIIRADGNTCYHKTFSSMLRKFDRQDLMDLHRLVMKRFKDNILEGYNLLLCGDLNSSLIADRWYFDVLQHVSMLNWKLKAEAESTMAFELLKFIKLQVEE
ncbi:hypothetical protein Tco_0514317 [Tanacetum coccineum]